MQIDINKVKQHITNLFGYHIKEQDEFAIRHMIMEAESLAKNFLHRNDLPEQIEHPLIEYTYARFILYKIQNSAFVDDEGNPLKTFSVPESSVKLGDMSISYEGSYGSMVDDNAFLAHIQDLANRNNLKKKIIHYRKVVW